MFVSVLILVATQALSHLELILSLAVPQIPPPAAFVDLTLTEADAKARSAGQILLVVVRVPIQLDEQFTIWDREGLSDRLQHEFVTIGVDASPFTKAHRRHKIAVFPTVLAFRNGVQVGRIDRPLNAQDVGEWLDRLATATPEQPARASGLGPVERFEGQNPMDLAQKLLANGQLDEAAEEFGRFWAIHPPEQSDFIRYPAGHLLVYVRTLLEACPECRTPIEDAANTLEHATYPGSHFDAGSVYEFWGLTTEGLTERDRPLEWVQTAAALGTFRASASTFRTLVETGIPQIIAQDLCRARLFRLAALVETDPLFDAHHRFKSWQSHPDLTKELGAALEARERASRLKWIIIELTDLHLTALAGGRIEDAREIACLALEAEPSDLTRIHLVAQALHARIVHPMHLELLDACARERQFQRPYVEAALRDWPRVWETPLEPALTNPASPQTPPPTPAP